MAASALGVGLAARGAPGAVCGRNCRRPTDISVRPWRQTCVSSRNAYGYATGVFSSRMPDQPAVSVTFRKHFVGKLKDLFVWILMVAWSMGF